MTQWVSGIGELHLVLAILLFYLINLIGQRSVTLGYVSVSLYMQQETSPAFNFVLRVISPTVYLIVVASLFYALNLDIFVKNLYLVTAYYILFRLAYNVTLGEPRLINWKRQLGYSVLMLLLSYFAYVKLISVKKNLLPDFSNLANELWVIIIIFIYNLVNDLKGSDKQTQERKVDYIEYTYAKLSNKYNKIVKAESGNELVRFIIYAIMIHENYNRPAFARKLEYILFFITKQPRTFGIMQVFFKVPVTDHQSVRLGAKRINKSYENSYEALNRKDEDKDEHGNIYPYYLRTVIMQVIGSYNTGNEYSNDVFELLEGLVIRHNKQLAETFVIE